MRKVCKKFADKFVKLLFALIIVITETVSPLAVLADSVIPSNIKKGDVYNPVTGSYGDSATITDGNSDVLGGVSVSKTVSKVHDEDGNVILGRYNVKFDVVGKNINKPDVKIKPIYVVIVFDTSGSMICDSAKGKGGYSTIVTRDEHYTASDGTKIACVDGYGYEKRSALTSDKWENAIKGASDFADALIAKDTNNTRDVAFVSLVTFSGSATTATEFKSKSNLTKDGKVFDEASFGHPYGGTDLAGGIKEAARKLDTVDDELDAQKFILVISDGEPTYYYGTDGRVSKAIKYAKKEATIAKNAGTSIYAIGYGINDTSNAASVLKYVSSNTTVVASNPTGDESGTYDNTKGFYYNADTSSIASALNSVFDSMVPKFAGTEATLVDTLGGNFVFTDSSDNHVDGNTYTYEIGDITEDGISFNFNIDINPDVPTGLYDTNSTYKLSYVDADSNSKDITPSKNPQVYWEANKYTYEIRYYKDVITDPSDSLHYINKVTGDSVKDKVIDVELDKYILDGYTLAPDNPTSLIVSTDNSSNIVNVLYVKRSDLSYTVRYYQDDLNNMIGSSSVSNVTYGDVIKLDTIDKNAMRPTGYKDGDIQNEEDLVIKVNGNYIDVLYTKDTFSYTVRYFYENVSYDSEESKYYENTEYMYLGSAEYNEKITNYIPHLEDGFRFEKVNPSELIVSSVEEDNVIRVYYVRNNYKFVIRHFYQDLKGNYNENKDYTIVGEAKYGTTLKSSDYEKHETDGYVFNKVDPSSLEIKSNNDNEMIFYYNLRSDLSYTVRYYQDDLNNMIGSSSVSNVTYGDVIKLDTIDKNAMRPTGYKDGDIQNEEDLVIKVNGNYIDVLYTKDTFSYTVRYFYENVSYDSEESKYYENTEYMYLGSAEYNEKITNYIPHLEDGFRFEKVNPSELIVSSVEEDNVIRVYYVRNNYKFVIRHFYQDLKGNYNENKDYTIVGEAKYGTTLKSSDYEKHETDGYVFNKVDPSSLEIKSNNDNEMIFYYNLRSDLSYTVRYYQDDLNNMIGSYSVNDVTYGDVIKLDTIDKNAMRPYGYKDGVIQNEEDLAIKVNGNYIDVLYVKGNGYVTEEALSKDGDNDLDNVNNSVDYNIRYASVIKDYVGKVTLTIVDELPYAIDLNKSNILDGIYDSKNNTITYIEVFDINEDNQVINFDREISISYIDIDSDIITNKVTSKVVLDSDVTSYCEDEVDTSVLMGKVIVKYVDRDGVELANSIEMTDLVGKLYNTYALEIKDYHLYSEPSNKDGSYTSDEIVVTYVYEKDGMGNDNPPHTGVSNYNNTYFSVLLLGVLVLIKKYVK